MIWPIVAVQSAFLAFMGASRRRAAVLRSLMSQRVDSAPIRALSRQLAARTQTATRLERAAAGKAAALIRGFVQTNAFDQLVVAVAVEIRRRLQKGGKR